MAQEITQDLTLYWTIFAALFAWIATTTVVVVKYIRTNDDKHHLHEVNKLKLEKEIEIIRTETNQQYLHLERAIGLVEKKCEFFQDKLEKEETKSEETNKRLLKILEELNATLVEYNLKFEKHISKHDAEENIRKG